MIARKHQSKRQRKAPPVQRQENNSQQANDLETLPRSDQPLNQHQILNLQRTLGNQAVQRMISTQGVKSHHTPAKHSSLQRDTDDKGIQDLPFVMLKAGSPQKGSQPTPVVQMRRTAPHIQRNIMPLNVWKDMSKLGILHTRSTHLELIDSTLDSYHNAKNDGQRFLALKALNDYIAAFERSKDGKESKRKEAIEVLKAQVTNELTGKGPTFQLWTIDQFTEATKEKGKLWGNASLSDFQEEIIDMMTQFHKLKDPTGADITRAIGLLYEMRDYADYWFEQHNARSEGKQDKRSNRAAGMQAFKDHLASIMPTVESFLDVGAVPVKAPKGRKRSGQSGKAPKEDAKTKKAREKKVQEIRDSHEGSAKSLFAKVGGFVLGNMADEAGSKCAVELEVRIPVDPNGVGFIGGRFSLEAEAEKSYSKLRAELALTGGAQIPKLATLSAELGGYFETQAQTPEKAMKLVSYAFYRKLRTTTLVPREVANYIWGGRTTELGWKIAERWAANVEKGVFGAEGGDDAYVETGLLAGAKAKVGIAEGAEGEAKVKATVGKKFSKKSISAVKRIGETYEPPAVRGQNQDDLSELVGALEVALGMKFGPLAGDFKLKFAGSELNGGSVEGELNAQVMIPGGDGITKVLVPTIEKVVMKLVDYLRSTKDLRKTAFKPVTVGDALSGAMLAKDWVKYLGSSMGEAAVGTAKDTAKSLVKMEAESGYGLNIKLGYNASGLEFQINVEKVGATNVDAGVAAVSLKTAKRIVGVHYKEGQWKLA